MLYCAQTCLYTLAAYYFRYIAQDMGKLTIALTIQSIASLAGAVLGPPISKRLGKKPSGVLTGILCTAFFSVLAIWGHTSWMFYVIGASGGLFSIGIIRSCGVNLYLDCGEYHLYKTGKNIKTFMMSMFGMSIKIGFALSSVAIAYLLEAVGYSGATNTVENVPLMSRLIGGILAGLSFAYALLMITYGISDAKAKEYAEHNHKAAAATA
jgi:Na+/melibiose symporter-like transporter